jgi:hypothetical protein
MVEKKFEKSAISASLVKGVHPKIVNMTFTGLPLLEFLSRLSELAKIAAPDDRAAIDKFVALNKKALEVDKEGRRTRAASEARRTLENPEMVSTPMKRGIAAKRKKLLKYSARATEAFAEATAAAGLLAQAELEMRIFEEAQPLPDNRKAYPSSETADPDLKYIDVWLREMDIKPYELARLSPTERGLIGRLLKDARNDPDYTSENNLWPLLFNAGVLNLKDAQPTQHQKDLMAEAWERNHYKYDTLLTQVQDRTGQRLDVTASFAAACQLVARRAFEMDSVEAMLLFCAYREKISLETEIVSAMMNIPADDRYRVEAAIQSIRLSGEVAHATDNNSLAKAVASIISCVNECDTRQHDVEDWVGILIENYVERGTFVTKLATNEQKFWALFILGLQLSELDKKYLYSSRPDIAGEELIEDYVPMHDDGFNSAWELTSHIAEAAMQDSSTSTNAMTGLLAAEDSVPPPHEPADPDPEYVDGEAAKPATPSKAINPLPGQLFVEPDILKPPERPSPYFDNQQTTRRLWDPDEEEDLE